jgi:hypothetical protein
MKKKLSKFPRPSLKYMIDNLVNSIFNVPVDPVMQVRKMLDINQLKLYIYNNKSTVLKLETQGIDSLSYRELQIMRAIDYAKNKLRRYDVVFDIRC